VISYICVKMYDMRDDMYVIGTINVRLYICMRYMITTFIWCLTPCVWGLRSGWYQPLWRYWLVWKVLRWLTH